MKHIRGGVAVLLTLAMALALALPASLADAAAKTKAVTLYTDSATQSKTTLKASGLKAKKATWKSSKKKVATVKAGKVTAKKTGKTTITAKQGKKTYKFTVTVKKVSISQKKATLTVDETLQLKLNGDKIKSAKSSNKAVATVTKAGKVTAKKAGTATITLTSKKGKKYTCKVTVKAKAKAPSTTDSSGGKPSTGTKPDTGSGTGAKPGTTEPTKPSTVAVTGISLNANTLSLKVGDTQKLAATVVPANASDKTVTFASSDAAVSSVSSDGVVTAKKAGTATITAKAGGKSASCAVTVEEDVPQPKDVTAASQAQLDDLLDSDATYDTITIQTPAEDSIEIRGESRPDTKLVIDAPNATIDNYVSFGNVTINAIASDTYVEHAGNSIDFAAESGHVVLADDAENGSFICVRSVADDIVIENNGKLNGLDIQTAGDVTITGDASGDDPVRTELSAPATIRTSIVLDITVTMEDGSDTTAKLILDLGAAAGTKVTVTNVEVIPTVVGVGTVDATVVDETGNVEDKQTIVAENIGAESDPAGEQDSDPEVKGTLADGTSGGAIAGAEVRLYRWSAAVAAGDTDAAVALASTTTEQDGSYTFGKIKPGNYVLVASADGFKTATADLLLANTAGSKDIVLIPSAADDEQPGSIAGQVIDSSQSGTVGIGGITVRLRSGAENVTGSALATTTTDEDGHFSFEEIEPGVYTIEVVDLRSGEAVSYVTTKTTVTVLSGSSESRSIGMTPTIEGSQLRFVLSWKAMGPGVPADLDSHLYGPNGLGGRFHTWFADSDYYDNTDDNERLIAWLDRDDTDYEGPETTTVEKLSDGTYTFFIHDYTNGSDRADTMLATSGARVEVYSGATLLRTYTVPSGKGNVWAVCSYDARGGLSDINTLMGADEASSTGDDYLYGGLYLRGVESNDIVTNARITGSSVLLTVTGGMTPDKVSQIVLDVEGGTGEVIYDDGNYIIKLTSESGAVRTYDVRVNVDYGDLYIADLDFGGVVTGGYVHSADDPDDYDYVRLDVTDTDFAAYKDSFTPVFESEGISYNVIYDSEEGDAYIDITKDGVTRRYVIHLSQDYGELRIDRFETNDMVTAFDIEDDMYVYLTVRDPQLDACKQYIKPVFDVEGISYVILSDEYDDDAYIDITKDGITRRYYLFLRQEWGNLWIDTFETNSVVTYSEISGNSVELWVTTTNFDDYKDFIKPIIADENASYEVYWEDEDDDSPRVAITNGELTRVYYLEVMRDESGGFRISGINANGVITAKSYVERYDDWIYLYTTAFDAAGNIDYDAVIAAFDAIVPAEGAEVTLSYDEDEDELRAVLTDGESERTYNVVVWCDWGNLAIEEILCNGVITNADIFDDDNEIYLYVTQCDFEAVEADFAPVLTSEAASYVLNRDEEGNVFLTVSADGRSHTYHVYINCDWQGVQIDDVTGSDGIEYDYMTNQLGVDTLYFYTNRMVDLDTFTDLVTFEFGSGVEEHTIRKNDEGYIEVVLSGSGIEHVYVVKFENADYDAPRIDSFGYDGNVLNVWTDESQIDGSRTMAIVQYEIADEMDAPYTLVTVREGLELTPEEGVTGEWSDDGTTYTLTRDSDGAQTVYRVSLVYYGDLRVTGFETNEVVSRADVWAGDANLTVTTTDFEAVQDYIKPKIEEAGATYRFVDVSDNSARLIISNGTLERTYWIYLYQDNQDSNDEILKGFKIAGIVKEVSEMGYGYADLTVSDMYFENFGEDAIVPVLASQSATYRIEPDDRNENGLARGTCYLRLIIDDEDESYEYTLFLRPDYWSEEYQNLALENVETKGVIRGEESYAEDDWLYLATTTDDHEQILQDFAASFGNPETTYTLIDNGEQIDDEESYFPFTLSATDGSIVRAYDVLLMVGEA